MLGRKRLFDYLIESILIEVFIHKLEKNDKLKTRPTRITKHTFKDIMIDRIESVQGRNKIRLMKWSAKTIEAGNDHLRVRLIANG